MKFNPRSISLPFYPGDKVYWVSPYTGSMGESTIKALYITEDSIQIFEDEVYPDERGPYDVDNDESIDLYFSSKEEAEKKFAAVMADKPVHGYWPDEGSDWQYASIYLPPDGKQVWVQDDDRKNYKCTFHRKWTSPAGETMKDVFISEEGEPIEADIWQRL